MIPLVVSALFVIVERNRPVVAWAIGAWLALYLVNRVLISSRKG